MRLLKAISLLLLTIPGASADERTVPEGIELNATIEYYDVSAPSFAKLAKRIKAAAPPDENGKTSVSSTQSTWKVGISTTTLPVQCRTESVTMKLNVVTTMPRWLEFDKAPHLEQDAWEKYQAGLRAHADGHIDIDVNTVSAIRDAILSVPSAANCDVLKSAMAQEASNAEASFTKAHANYDKETKDGRSQGALLEKQLD